MSTFSSSLLRIAFDLMEWNGEGSSKWQIRDLLISSLFLFSGWRERFASQPKRVEG